jgi:hypothetical protein
MGPDLLSELRDAFDKSASGEDFVNRIMVGDCPHCGCSKTGDCENDPEIIGRIGIPPARSGRVLPT